MNRSLARRLHKVEATYERRHPRRHKTDAEIKAEWAAFLDAHPFWDKLTIDEQDLGIFFHIHHAHFPALTQAHVDAADHYARTGERPAILDEIPRILGRASA